MGMNSIQKRISKDSTEEAMDMRKMVAVDEKFISRSYFKEDRVTDPPIQSKRSKSKYSKNKLGKKLAEVFRTDFITAMMVPESQQLPPGEYLTLTDTWRQEWEKGVQVPVNPEAILHPVSKKLNIDISRDNPFSLPDERLKFDQSKYIATMDRGNTSCNYDLDDLDVQWLKKVSSLRTLKKASNIDELTMERAITFFERQCFEKMAHAVATKEGLSIEYDESTTCNVCLSPDAEDGNEIIFCDACMMCAHQHCYGVLDIPEGTWLCNPCSRGVLSPPCCLCPNKGGAMKRMKDSFEWIHVICAWWVPEVKIEDVRYIERITKDKIPLSRWSLSCNVCRERIGACIQCSVKRCVRAYHITCAVKEGLEMKTVVVPEKNDVQHVSFCSKHCTPVPPEQNPNRSKSGEDMENNRMKELRKLESEFYTLVSINKASRELKLSKEVCRRLLSYWTMKRRANDNVPLIKLTLEQQEKLSGKMGVVFINQQKTLEMERFLHLRQDLERLRNLCYMIVRREKVRKELHRSSREVFYKQNDILLDDREDLSGDNLDFIRHRTAKFSCFSEHYQTEGQYETEFGTRPTIFDSTLEEGDELLNTSQLERLDLMEFERKDNPIGTTSRIRSDANSRVCSGNTSRIDTGTSHEHNDNIFRSKNDGEDVIQKIETELSDAGSIETGITGKKTEAERNIFELLEPKTEESLDKVISSSPNKVSHENTTVSMTDESKNSRKESEDTDSTSKTCLNGYLASEDEINVEIEVSNCAKKAPLPNNAKTSRLVKKGKKRFRNLHNIERQGCRNSPRLNKISPENEVKDELGNDSKNEILDENRLSKIIHEAKRRRLTISGDFICDYDDEPPDYVRVTRSRLASYS